MAPSSALVARLKVHLKLAISRLRIVQQKDSAIAKQQRRAMAQLLEQGKYESARIRVENIIRSDLTTELYEILELYCELLLARIGLLEPAACDPGLEEAVKSIIYAAPRTDIKELQQARQLLVEKFGKDFSLAAMENTGNIVPDRVMRKLRVEPPEKELVESYLKAIATAYDVKYGDEEEVEGEDKGPGDDEDDHDSGEPGSGGQAVRNLETPLLTQDLSKMTPPRDLGPKSPVSIAPPSPSTDNANPRVKVPGRLELRPNAKIKKQGESNDKSTSTAKSNGPAAFAGKPDGDVPDVDDLEKRFALLKK